MAWARETCGPRAPDASSPHGLDAARVVALVAPSVLVHLAAIRWWCASRGRALRVEPSRVWRLYGATASLAIAALSAAALWSAYDALDAATCAWLVRGAGVRFATADADAEWRAFGARARAIGATRWPAAALLAFLCASPLVHALAIDWFYATALLALLVADGLTASALYASHACARDPPCVGGAECDEVLRDTRGRVCALPLHRLALCALAALCVAATLVQTRPRDDPRRVERHRAGRDDDPQRSEPRAEPSDAGRAQRRGAGRADSARRVGGRGRPTDVEAIGVRVAIDDPLHRADPSS